MPRRLKQAAISQLEGSKTGQQQLDKQIEKIIERVKESLVSHGQSLFIDDTRLLPPPIGKGVFNREEEAVSALLEEIKKARAPSQSLDTFRSVIQSLVQADEMIARASLMAAKALAATGQGNSKRLRDAEDTYAAGIQAALADDPRRAIRLFQKSWEDSQSVVKDHDLFISVFGDSPDPFSPNADTAKDTSMLAVTVEVRRRETLEDIEENHKKFEVELIQKITDSSGQVLREIKNKADLPQQPTSGKERSRMPISVNLETTWDGRDSAGRTLADGTYAYVALAHLIRVRTPGRHEDDDEDDKKDDRGAGEKIVATAFPVVGRVVLDATAPEIRNMLPVEGAILRNARPEVSAQFFDNLAGIDPASGKFFLDGEELTSLATISATGLSFVPHQDLVDGLHRARIEISDLADTKSSEERSFTTDITPPEIFAVSPADGSEVREPRPAFFARFRDLTSGIQPASARLKLDGVDVPVMVDGDTATFVPTEDLTDGLHSYEFRISDVAGSESAVTVTFRVILDVTPPVISGVSPADKAILNNGRPTLSATFSDDRTGVNPDSIVIIFDGVDITENASISFDGFSFTPLTDIAETVHTLEIRVQDFAKNQAVSLTTFTTDVTLPDISFLTPADEAILNTTRPTISGNFSDNLSGVNVNSVSILLDGLEVAPVANVTEAGFSFTPDFDLADSVHELSIDVADRATNRRSSLTTFTTDVVIPEIAGLEPSDGTASNDKRLGFFATLNDVTAGIDADSVRLSLDGATVSAEVSVASVSFNPEADLSEGFHVYRLSVRDRATNEAIAETGFLSDFTDPSISSLRPEDGKRLAQARPEISGSLFDALSGIDVPRVALFLDGAEITSSAQITEAGFNFNPAADLSDGRHQLTARAFDRASNASVSQTSFLTDATGPAVSNVRPANGSVVNNSRQFFLAAVTDAVTEVDPDSIILRLNGMTVGHSFDSDTGLVTFTPGLTLSEDEHQYELSARDTLSNLTTLTTVFRVNKIRVTIASPQDGAVFTSPDVTVQGTVDPGIATVVRLMLGRMDLQPGNTFSKTIVLREGRNILAVAATDEFGNVGTASVSVVLDRFDPRVKIQIPEDGAVVSAPRILVSGFVHDIKDGTVNDRDVSVTVNGVAAQVSNRKFIASEIQLQEGLNLIQARITDAAGHEAVDTVGVTLDTSPKAKIEVVLGNNQKATINTRLAEPLVVRLTDAAGSPVEGANVVFKVKDNDGTVDNPDAIFKSAIGRSIVVRTGADGLARAFWTLGGRAGVAVNRIEASCVRFAGPATFYATGLPGKPVKVNAHAGERQRGLVGEPAPVPLAVLVSDEADNGCEGCAVTLKVERGGGSFDGETSLTVETNSNGHAFAVWTLGPEAGLDNQKVTASIPGLSDPIANTIGLPSGELPSIPAEFIASAFRPGPIEETKVSGVILDNQNEPVSGATLHIEGTALGAISDTQGQFTISGAPVGFIRLKLDARSVDRPGKWSDMEYDFFTFPGVNNHIGMPILILPLNEGEFFDGTQDVTVTLPEVPGFELFVPKQTRVTFPDGLSSGRISVTQVHSDKVPMVPEDGMQPRFFITIQPAGAHFDPPARITYPNVEGFRPGQIIELFSFDHDLGAFLPIGTGQVSEDGLALRSDPGVGILKGGWHCGSNSQATGKAEKAKLTLPGGNIICVGKPTEFIVFCNPPGGTFSCEVENDSILTCQVIPTDPKNESRFIAVGTFLFTGKSPGSTNVIIKYKCPNTQQIEESEPLNITVIECIRSIKMIGSRTDESKILAGTFCFDSASYSLEADLCSEEDAQELKWEITPGDQVTFITPHDKTKKIAILVKKPGSYKVIVNCRDERKETEFTLIEPELMILPKKEHICVGNTRTFIAQFCGKNLKNAEWLINTPRFIAGIENPETGELMVTGIRPTFKGIEYSIQAKHTLGENRFSTISEGNVMHVTISQMESTTQQIGQTLKLRFIGTALPDASIGPITISVEFGALLSDILKLEPADITAIPLEREIWSAKFPDINIHGQASLSNLTITVTATYEFEGNRCVTSEDFTIFEDF